MHIALVSQEYPPETAKGGLGTQTAAKARGLSMRGHDIVVLSRATDGRLSETTEGRVTVIRVPGAEERLALHTEVADWVTYSAEVAAVLEKVHARRPLDLVDFPEWAAEGYVFLINRTEWNRIPTVVHLHGPLVMFAHTIGWPEPASEFYRTGTMLEGTCVRLADAIVSSSRCSLDWCARHYGIATEGVPIFHTGIDTDHFSPAAGARAARPTIIFAGKVVRNKGVCTLVPAALRLMDEFPDLHLRLLGRGNDRMIADLRGMAERAGRTGLLDFAGFVLHDTLPAQLASAHVFAGPSTYEPGPGFVYLEAMACGLPVIASAGSGGAEVVQDGVTGYLVPPDNVEALAAALRSLLGDREARERMGKNARAYAETEAATPRCIERLEKIYAGIVERFRTPGARP